MPVEDVLAVGMRLGDSGMQRATRLPQRELVRRQPLLSQAQPVSWSAMEKVRAQEGIPRASAFHARGSIARSVSTTLAEGVSFQSTGPMVCSRLPIIESIVPVRSARARPPMLNLPDASIVKIDCQINCVVGDCGNAAKISILRTAPQRGADLMLTPELALCGYHRRPPVAARFLSRLQRRARARLARE